MGNLIQTELSKELGQNFINYAVAVNSDRSIPDSFTGLKPVARRIMFVMDDEGFCSSKPHKKSAKAVGSIMGRVHPHGDSSIYEAMIRLSQEWVMRYPLVDIHGNNGNIDGDGPAASRYTEARLSKLAEDGLLGNLKKNNVDWAPNYSEDEDEPISLPALFPNLLCNPNMGIGVAMACNWLPHNLTEVGNLILKYLETGEMNFDNMAPDFPTGGIIINGKDLSNIYLTGKGKVVIRGKYEIETRAKKTLIVFTELPYTVRTEDLLDQIKDACDKEDIVGVEEVRNESGKKGIRIVFELSKDASEGQVLKQIWKNTDLQKSLSANQVGLLHKTPKQLTWRDCIDIYITKNYEVIEREASFDMKKALARLEVVKGLLRALEDIDNIIALIKESKSAAAAKQNLMAKYEFTEPQAKAIVDMKLGRLAGLEKMELNQEKADLDKTIDELDALINQPDRQKEELINRLRSFVKKYGDARRTEVTHIDIKPEEKEIAEVVPEDVVVVVTQSGLVKRVPATAFKVQKKGGKGVKSQDDSILEVIKTNTVDVLMLFSTKGKMYRILVDNLPSGTTATKGVPISTLITLENGEKIIAVTSLHRTSMPKYVIFITKNGMVKKSYLEEYMKAKRNAGILALTLKDDDSIVDISFQDEEDLLLITEKGMSIRFATKDITPIGRVSMGVKGIKLNADDRVVAALPVHKETDNVAIFSSAGLGKQTALSEYPLQGRGGKGTYTYKPNDQIGYVVGAEMVDADDNLLICGNYSSICISAKDIPVIGKIGAGNILLKNNKVISVTKV